MRSNIKRLIAGLQGFHGLRRHLALECFEEELDEELRFGMGLLLNCGERQVELELL